MGEIPFKVHVFLNLYGKTDKPVTVGSKSVVTAALANSSAGVACVCVSITLTPLAFRVVPGTRLTLVTSSSIGLGLAFALPTI